MVKITETVLRDANQSLMATRMPFSAFEKVLPVMDKAGYYSIECWGGATFDSCLRYLDEDPWERLRRIRAACPNSKLQMLLRGQNLLGYKHYPDDVVRLFVKKSIENGIDIIRIPEKSFVCAVSIILRIDGAAEFSRFCVIIQRTSKPIIIIIISCFKFSNKPIIYKRKNYC